jgi:hypothetical protein
METREVTCPPEGIVQGTSIDRKRGRISIVGTKRDAQRWMSALLDAYISFITCGWNPHGRADYHHQCTSNTYFL